MVSASSGSFQQHSMNASNYYNNMSSSSNNRTYSSTAVAVASAAASTATLLRNVPADSPERLPSPDPVIGSTAAEMILPWRRDRSYQSIGKCCH